MFVPNVFQTAYQTCPLDLHTDAFFHSRASEINRRLVEIENGAAGAIIQSVDAEERARGTCIIGLDWGYEVAHLLEIAECFQGAALAVVCRVLAQEYRRYAAALDPRADGGWTRGGLVPCGGEGGENKIDLRRFTSHLSLHDAASGSRRK
ncbi:hypothetical protein BGT96224_5027B [Blumeria graminis f. sp. tritici 96224]|uniref:Fanconi-associated nuclease n=1 Tax=Blumeria graminis f. sp. tritici 96224 TaxID=1268274 RepID=A0A061HGX2_BLUGR|nr:hypothetical protein BGT96224_5027B [Blumeria graminis f. sp. tritici 96224]